MYIDPMFLVFTLIVIGVVALVYFIITLYNVNKLLKNANDILSVNSVNIEKSLVKLPKVIDNFGEVSENMKEVTEVVTDITADVIVAKDNVKLNIDLANEIISIIKSIFK